MMTARSAAEPVTASVTLSMIGCVKLKAAPGISLVQLLAELVDQIRFAHAGRPGIVGLQRDEEFVAIGP